VTKDLVVQTPPADLSALFVDPQVSAAHFAMAADEMGDFYYPKEFPVTFVFALSQGASAHLYREVDQIYVPKTEDGKMTGEPPRTTSKMLLRIHRVEGEFRSETPLVALLPKSVVKAALKILSNPKTKALVGSTVFELDRTGTGLNTRYTITALPDKVAPVTTLYDDLSDAVAEFAALQDDAVAEYNRAFPAYQAPPIDRSAEAPPF
jgi:hypothetical protein